MWGQKVRGTPVSLTWRKSGVSYGWIARTESDEGNVSDAVGIAYCGTGTAGGAAYHRVVCDLGMSHSSSLAQPE